jgi:hypothetical protein
MFPASACRRSSGGAAGEVCELSPLRRSRRASLYLQVPSWRSASHQCRASQRLSGSSRGAQRSTTSPRIASRDRGSTASTGSAFSMESSPRKRWFRLIITTSASAADHHLRARRRWTRPFYTCVTDLTAGPEARAAHRPRQSNTDRDRALYSRLLGSMAKTEVNLARLGAGPLVASQRRMESGALFLFPSWPARRVPAIQRWCKKATGWRCQSPATSGREALSDGDFECRF